MSEPTSAIFKAVVMTALVDGRPSLSEARVVSELIELDPSFVAIEDALELGVQARVALDAHGLEDAMHALCASITAPSDQLLAFRLCARVMIADGKTEGEEAMVLGCLQEEFALPNSEVVAILDEERKRKAAP
jgi:hypothetical protein